MVLLELDEQGIPMECRYTVWNYYLKNKQKINKEIF